jgi:hypothetical protein
MPKTPTSPDDRPVVFDNDSSLWELVKAGLVDSTEVTESCHLKIDTVEDRLPAPSPTNYASPYSRQTPPSRRFPNNGQNIVQTPAHPAREVATPNAPLRPTRLSRLPLENVTNARRLPLPERAGAGEVVTGADEDNVRIRILKNELYDEEQKHAISRGLVRRFLSVANDIENVEFEHFNVHSGASTKFFIL